MARTLGFCVVSALCAHAGHAQTVYKWTDANGQVHYSEKKDGAAAKAQEMKIAPSPPAPPPPPAAPKASEADPWEVAFRKPKPRQDFSSQHPPAAQPPRSVSGGRENGTDASRCNLARDVLNGSLRHGNGAPVDQYDRDVATADVKRFCR